VVNQVPVTLLEMTGLEESLLAGMMVFPFLVAGPIGQNHRDNA